jgi:uncharacterized cupredoxin-like copper-binding protein
MKVRTMLGTIGLASALALTACGGGGNSGSTSGGTAASGSGGAAAGGETKTVQGTAALKFEPTTLQAPAGKEFEVKLTNTATAGIKHNFVLVKPGQDQTVASAVSDPNGEIPDKVEEQVIAHTKTIDGGNSDTVEVGDLEAGTYPYICTVPGHYAAGMKGTLTVK